MGSFVTPKAYLIAETSIDDAVMLDALRSLGVENWTTDSDNDAEILTEFAGKSCYMSFDTSLNSNLTKVGTRSNHDYIQKGIVAQHHGSVLEHSTVTFFLTNVSRIVTHELVRHRAGAAYSQTSGRYVRTDNVQMYFPYELDDYPAAADIFRRAMQQMEDSVAELARITDIDNQDFATKKRLTSAFRRLIGNGQSNHIVVTANHRSWRHMIEMRTSPHAEEEIRIVFADISRQLRAKFPAIYADAKVYEVDAIEVTEFEHSKV